MQDRRNATYKNFSLEQIWMELAEISWRLPLTSSSLKLCAEERVGLNTGLFVLLSLTDFCQQVLSFYFYAGSI